MEKEINIAEILKDKPLDIKLWTDIFGEVTLDYVSKNGNGFNVKHHHSVLDKFLPNGKIYEEGALCIYPSKSMRDWSKLAWKKGDVLEYTEGEEPYYAIFEAFQDDEYTAFKSRYNFNGGNHWLQFNSQSSTNHFTKVSDEEAKAFIEKVEAHYGGKLNLETLEIEKPQFKDGDIMYMEAIADSYIFIFNKNDNGLIRSRVSFSIKDKVLIDFGFTGLAYEHNYKYIRPATEEEKQLLFAALAKENKAWDSDKKQIVDLPKKCEFKPLDYILVRDKGHVLPMWQLYQYAHENKNYIYVVGSLYGLDKNRIDFIPYNDKTAHLLGTTDDWEGGEE